MPVKKIQFTEDPQAKYAGMGDFLLIAPNMRNSVELIYEGEPPHGDSYHRATIDGIPFPGHVWGSLFGFSSCSRYFVFSWMSKLFERRTVVADIQTRCYFVLPEYIYKFKVRWPMVLGDGELSNAQQYIFTGSERWLSYE